MTKNLYVFTDGGARGNPGPAAVGFVVKDEKGRVLIEQGKFIGWATNNIAEYRAVIEALRWIKENFKYKISNIKFFLDSNLVVNQLNGLFKIKNKKLRNLIIETRKLEQGIGGNVFYNFIRRGKNRKADFLVCSELRLKSPIGILEKTKALN
jgi:ribonuclease HI